jgi:beta-barrel assembly-enhancing protease
MERTFQAWHFDGETAIRRNVDVQIIGSTFILTEPERRSDPVAFADLYFVGHQRQSAVYGIKERDGWRLGLNGDVPPELSAMLPRQHKYGGFIDRIGLGPSMVVLAAISAACIGVAVYTPQWLAPLVPFSVEQKLGNTLVGDFGGEFCHTPKGDAALAKLARSLDSNSGDLKISVSNIDMVNAVALPGGNIILFDGLVRQAKSPDAVAGVLAHEMGHVRERHVMEGLLRQLGMAVVLSGTSGNTGGMLNDVLSLSYGRDAEEEADEHSIAAMRKASISPVDTADFFEKMGKEDGSSSKEIRGNKVAGYLTSHPVSADRQRNFQKSLIKGKPYKPSLSSDAWFELKTMCAQDPKANGTVKDDDTDRIKVKVDGKK